MRTHVVNSLCILWFFHLTSATQIDIVPQITQKLNTTANRDSSHYSRYTAAADEPSEFLKHFGEPRPSKILLQPPLLFDSHLFIFKELAAGLNALGHEVTFFVSDRRNVDETDAPFKLEKFRGIFSSAEGTAFLNQKIQNILSYRPTVLEMFDILRHYVQNCDMIFTDGVERLRNMHFDLVIVDPNEMCGFLLAAELNLPFVVFSTGMWVPVEAGIPAPISYVPEFNSQLTDDMNFLDRLKNTAVYIISRIGTNNMIFPMYDRLIRKHGIGLTSVKTVRRLKDIINRSSGWLLCTDMALDFPRPSLPNVEYVGGFLNREPKSLHDKWKKLADSSNEGMIIVTFGAGVERLSNNLETTFYTVLCRIPLTVIWRYPAVFDVECSNVHIVDWIPQADLLGHANVQLFIGHGGTNGVYESIYNGVPIIGMPLFGDHFDSVTRVEAKGAGLKLIWQTLDEKTLEDAIYEVLNNQKYRINVQKLSKIHKDASPRPRERAVRFIDYLIRYEGAEHLRPRVHGLNFVQYFMLDVISAFVLALSVLILVTRSVIRYSFCLEIRHKDNEKVIDKKDDDEEEAEARKLRNIKITGCFPFVLLTLNTIRSVILRLFRRYPGSPHYMSVAKYERRNEDEPTDNLSNGSSDQLRDLELAPVKRPNNRLDSGGRLFSPLRRNFSTEGSQSSHLIIKSVRSVEDGILGNSHDIFLKSDSPSFLASGDLPFDS